MDGSRFDQFVRRFSSPISRRSALARLTGGFLAILPLATGAPAAAKHKKHKKHKQHCTPQCQGKTCGQDGCGGSCGTCPGSGVCTNGTCVCTPQCQGKNCGSDGCGSSCGSCAPQTCVDTTLTTYSCDNGVCAPHLTDCGTGKICNQDSCCTRKVEPSCHKTTIDDLCGHPYQSNCVTGACCHTAAGLICCTKHCCDAPTGGLFVCQTNACS
jgi:hypothetical protein